jgi:hypothetical protein
VKNSLKIKVEDLSVAKQVYKWSSTPENELPLEPQGSDTERPKKGIVFPFGVKAHL